MIPLMSSNLTWAGWLLLLGAIVILGVGWYVFRFLLDLQFNIFIFVIGGGIGLMTGGGALLKQWGVEMMK